jgi:hypothetical protein
MKALKTFDWETAKARWVVTVTATPTGYRCEYSGTSPKFAPVKSPTGRVVMMADMGRNTFLGNSLEHVLEQARSQIEAIDGPIEREYDRTVT